MISIENGPSTAVHWLHYSNAKRGGGRGSTQLAFECYRATGLPEGLDAVVATSDLQGMVFDPRTRESRLLGVEVCGHDRWQPPLAHHAAGQILNVDARVVVLQAQ